MESERDRRFALEGFVRYHDDRIWKQTQKLVREEKEAITKMAVTLTAIRITAIRQKQVTSKEKIHDQNQSRDRNVP